MSCRDWRWYGKAMPRAMQARVNPLAMARDFDEPRGRPPLWNAAEVTKLAFITAIEPSGVGG